MVKVIPQNMLSRKSFLAMLVALVVVAVIAGLELTNTTHIFHKKAVPASIPVTTNKSNSSQKSKNSSAAPSNQADSQNTDKVASSAGGGSSATLVQPYGNLVSNHFPGQNGGSTKEQSACNTTPGASCYIQFTNTSTGKVTKLPVQTVASDGSTTWLWDANTLTSGKWQITATATLNGQTKSVTDTIKLEIQ